MKIGICGAQGTGKSTIKKLIGESPKFKDFRFIDSFVRKLNQDGFKINQEGDEATQLKVMQTHNENASKVGNFLFDRCLLDGLSYTKYLFDNGKVNEETLKECEKIFLDNYKKYDYICYIPIEFKLVDDGFRSLDLNFQRDIDNAIIYYINKYKLNIILLTGSPQERLRILELLV